MNVKQLQGRVAIVTGSARNIGRAIALILAEEGASIVVNARSSMEDANLVADAIRAIGGQAIICLADVSQPEGAQKLIDAAIEHFGRIDMLINNAAVRRHSSFDNLKWQECREVIGWGLPLRSRSASIFTKIGYGYHYQYWRHVSAYGVKRPRARSCSKVRLGWVNSGASSRSKC